MDGVLGFVCGAIFASIIASAVGSYEDEKRVRTGFYMHGQKLYLVAPAKAVSP